MHTWVMQKVFRAFLLSNGRLVEAALKIISTAARTIIIVIIVYFVSSAEKRIITQERVSAQVATRSRG